MTLNDRYDLIFQELVTAFDERYFDWEKDYYIIGSWGRLAPNVVGWQERYHFNIDQIYEALKHGLPKKKILDRHDYCVDELMEKRSPTSLVNYCLGMEEYTKEQKKEAKRNIAQSKKLLQEAILEINNKKNAPTKRK